MEIYKDKNYSPKERAQDLLSKMTLEQKLGQLLCKMFMADPKETLQDLSGGVGEALSVSAARTPEEIAAYNKEVVDAVMEKTGGIPPVFEVEALCGLVSGGASSFPSPIGLGATFDTDAVQGMSDIIRGQMLAVGLRRACSPVMDVAKDPRWGRMGETYGEDPALAAAMSTAFVKGLQSEDLTEGVAATGKHFLGYAMGEGGYNSANNSISPRELREVYAKPFQAAITDADLQTVMNSYGAPDGEPVAGSKAILKGLLREEMGFEGLTVSDYGSIGQLYKEKRVCDSEAEAAARAMRAGMDMENPNPEVYPCLKEALEQGLVSQERIDEAVLHILEGKFKLGLFENPYPRTDLLQEAYGNPAHMEHSRKLARESIVLLKNDGVLPLKKDVKKIAVIGPRGNSIRMMFGGYTAPAGLEMNMGGLLADVGIGIGGELDEYYPGSCIKKEAPQLEEMLKAMLGDATPTIYQAVAKRFADAEVVFAKGCDIAGNDRSGFAEAVQLAKKCDAVILAVGGKYGWGEPCTSGEGRDTSDIGLPGVQEELMEVLCETGTPVIVVHGDTRPISSVCAKEKAAAVMEAWCPGMTGGLAVADVLSGDYNPAGRLPVTALEHAGQVPMYAAQRRGSLMSLDQRQPGFNSFANGIQEPLWYFGEGLSYTSFAYSDMKAEEQMASDGTFHISLKVTNTGDRDGEEVVQLYFTDERASVLRPMQELAGACRVSLSAGETKEVCFELRVDQTAFLNEDMKWTVEAGEITLKAGASSVDIRSSVTAEITDTREIDGTKRGFWAKSYIK